MKLRLFSLGLHGLAALAMSCGPHNSMIKENQDSQPEKMESVARHQGIVYEVDMAEQAPENEDATSLAPALLAPGLPGPIVPPVGPVPPILPLAPALPVLPVPALPVPVLPGLPAYTEFLPGLYNTPPWRANYINSYGQLPTRVATGGPFLYSHKARSDW